MKPKVTSSFTTALLTTDAHGSILQHSSEQKSTAFIYTPFGYNLIINRLTSTLGFNAQARDCSGFYLLGNGYRAYNPALSIFLSPDHHSPFGKGGANSYGYCKGDPINYQDPTGEAEVHARVLKVMRIYSSWDAFEQDNQPRTARELLPAPAQQAFPAQPQDNQPLARNHDPLRTAQPAHASPPIPLESNRVADSGGENTHRASSPGQAFLAVLRSRFRSIVRRILPRSRSSSQQLNAPPPPVPNSTARMHQFMQAGRAADDRNTSWSASGNNGRVRTND
jgi:RHS repeat-associated protein